MSGFLYTLLVTSVCGALCTMLSFGGFEKHIKYIASLICICVMISPLRDIDISAAFDMQTDYEIENEEKTLYPIATEIAETRAEEYINEIVFSEFGIKPKSTDIKIDWSLNEPIIENIVIVFSQSDMTYSANTKEYLKNVLGGEVEIVEG